MCAEDGIGLRYGSAVGSSVEAHCYGICTTDGICTTWNESAINDYSAIGGMVNR